MGKKLAICLPTIGLLVLLVVGCSKQEVIKQQEVTIPEITTQSVSDVSYTTAVTGGKIVSDGGAAVTECGVSWSTVQKNLSITDTIMQGTLTDSTFICELTGLTPNTTYYTRAYAVNSAGVAYGKATMFTTGNYHLPVISTSEVTEITQTTATCGGKITFDGGTDVSEYGICWGTAQNPTVSNEKAQGSVVNGSFSCAMTGLLPNTTYYVRAYAINRMGTGYGDEVSFKTLEAKDYKVSVDFECGTALSPSHRPDIFVIWMENDSASFIQNMFICKKLIVGGLTGTALPYWKVNKYPLSSATEVDAVTSATLANQDFTVSATLKDQSIRNFKLFFEIDHSFDDNDWFSDQPALLYSVNINLNDTVFELSPVGWTPNENTENQVANTSMGVLQSEMRYITNLKDGSSFGTTDSRSSTNMVKRIRVRIE